MKPHLGNPNAQQAERRIDQLYKSQCFADLKKVMELPDGRRFVYRIIFDICHVEALSFTGNSETYLREGERNAGLTLMNELIDKHPDAYMLMITEALESRKEEILKRKRARETPEPRTTEENDE